MSLERIRRTVNFTLALVCVGFALVATGWLIRTKPAPPTKNRFARVLEVTAMPVEPRSIGFLSSEAPLRGAVLSSEC